MTLDTCVTRDSAVTRDPCRCECRDRAGRARCLAAEAKVWDDSECRCGCRTQDSDCPTGMRVDPATCRYTNTTQLLWSSTRFFSRCQYYDSSDESPTRPPLHGRPYTRNED